MSGYEKNSLGQSTKGNRDLSDESPEILPRLNSWIDDAEETNIKWLSNMGEGGDLIESDSEEL